MAEFAQLMTKITADNKDFLNKVDQASKSADNFGGKMLKMGAIGAGVIAGTLTLAFAGLVHVINDTTDEISKLVDNANRLGTSVAGLQKLEYAAKLADVSSEQLNQGLKKMTMSIIAAGEGVGKAQKAFAALGITQQQLAGMSMDQQYLAIADAIKQIPDKAKQAEIALAIFGRSGITQLTLLRDDIKGAYADFERFGAALTDKQAAAVESYGDSLDRLSAIFDAFKMQLTAAVAPAFEVFTKAIGDSIIEMGGLGEVGKQVGVFIVDGLLLATQAFQGLLNFVDAVVAGFNRVKLKMLEVAQTFDNLGFAITGGEIDFERGLEIAKLQKELARSSQGGEFTSGIQGGLKSARNAITGASNGGNQKGTIDVKISAEDGLNAKVAESPEVTRMINLMVRQTMAKEATSVGS